MSSSTTRSSLTWQPAESGLCAECFEQADERSRKGVFATLIGYLRAPFTGYEGGNSNNILANESLFRIQSDVIRNIAANESAIFVDAARTTSCVSIRGV